MKTRTLTLLFTGLFLATLPLVAQTNPVVIFPDEDPLTPENLKLVWPTTPGLRYEVRQSTNLQTWTSAPGYPATANGPAQQMPFATTNATMFFQVRELDEQPPAIASQYPQDGGFAVPRFADLTLQLSDVTGINTNSIRLTVGSLGTFTLTNAQLMFSNNLLTFINGGSIPLGGWGSNVQATLIVADTLGYTGTNTWTFDLEVEPQVVTNLFVFGSPQAQRTGQQIGNIPTAALARRFGPIPMGDGDPWTLELVATNRLELSYTNTAPGFTVGQYVCNLTPATTDDIFYRKITALSDNAGLKRLTLDTTNVPLAEILGEGSASISANSVMYQVSNNIIIKAFAYNGVIPLGQIGLNQNDAILYQSGGVALKLKEAKFLLTPSLELSFETHYSSLQKFDARLRGPLEMAVVPELTIAGSVSDSKNYELFSKKYLVYVGSVGIVPVWLDFDFKVNAEVGYTLSGDMTMTTGVRKNLELTFGVNYEKGRVPQLKDNNSAQSSPVELLPLTQTINGSGSAYAKLIPQLDLRVNSLAGLYANVDPRVEVDGAATIINSQLSTADFTLAAKADLNVGLSIIGIGNVEPPLATWNLFNYPWSTHYPPPPQISIRHQPESQTVVAGDYASFTVDALYSQPLSYQWFYGELPLPDKTGPTMVLLNVTTNHAGPYYVRVSSGSLTTNSADAILTVIPQNVYTNNMALIPAGSFTMGDTLGDTRPEWRPVDEIPTHTVYVSAFYMDKYEVTKALWDEVYNWAITHGYSFDFGAQGKASNHPAHSISWVGAVKWCNARSEKEGRVPAYYTDAAQTTVYRSSQNEYEWEVDNIWVKWNAGYRLPTEAEWEKAARGGASGQRFPWGNTISWSLANYQAHLHYDEPVYGYAYDVNPTPGRNPTFNDGVYPYTSPAGYFAPNGYGLYDMVGNVWEYCWDWYGYYSSDSQTDPRGPAAVWHRVYRGGDWGNSAFDCRTAVRNNGGPPDNESSIGFRSVLPSGQP